jgi:hypothetical protein
VLHSRDCQRHITLALRNPDRSLFSSASRVRRPKVCQLLASNKSTMSFTRQTLRTARAGPSVSRRSLATPTSLPTKPCESITPPYPRLLETLKDVRNVLGRDTKLTLAEKILYSHLRNPEESLGGKGRVRGEKYLKLAPDRVAMQVGTLSFGLANVRTLLHRWLCSNS